MSANLRTAGGDELLFATLRMLIKAHLLWGLRAALHLPDLCGLLATSEARLRPVLYVLFRDGWITRNEEANTVCLTPSGVRHFLSIQTDSTLPAPLI